MNSRRKKNCFGEFLFRHRLSKPIRILIVTVLAALALFILFDLSVRKPLRALAGERALESISEILNSAVLETLTMRSELGTNTFTSVESSDDGTSILFIDAREMGILSSEIIDNAMKRIEALEATGIDVPAGSAFSSALLNGKGPKLNIRIDRSGAVTGRFSSSFSDAGVNQTRYCAKIELHASLAYTLCGSTERINAEITAPIVETIIVGGVPQAYTNVRSIDEALNLIPTDVE